MHLLDLIDKVDRLNFATYDDDDTYKVIIVTARIDGQRFGCHAYMSASEFKSEVVKNQIFQRIFRTMLEHVDEYKRTKTLPSVSQNTTRTKP